MIKIKHTMLALILSVLMICNSLGVMANDTTADLANEHIPLATEEFDALKTMGLLGDDIINMSATQEVTRAQFIGNLFKIAGYTEYEYKGEDIPFIDVSIDTPYKDEICYFHSMGFINGVSENVFAPNDKITYVQAIKLIIDVLGYTEYTQAKYGMYPDGYIATAQVLDLTDGIKTGGVNQPLTAEKAVRLLYNAGRTKVMESSSFTTGGEILYEINGSKELLSQNNHIYYGEGIVESNGIVSLVTGERTENIAVIDKKEFIISENIDITSLLGCRVKYFYKSENSDDILLWATYHLNNDVITVRCEELLPEDASYSKTTIVYTRNNKRTTVNIDEFANVIYNNSIHNVYSILKPKSGTIKFIDNNNDNIYDIVIVEEFKNMFVKSIVLAGNFIVGKYNSTIYLDDYKNVKIIDKGRFIELSEMRNNCIISYVESLDKDYLYIYVNDTGKTDILQATGEENGETLYYFSDAPYTLAENYKEIISAGNYNVVSPQIGRNYRYYLDMSGNIAEIEEEVDEKLQYAYLINAIPDDDPLGDRETAIVRLLLQNGEKVTATTKKKIKLNGNKDKTGADLLADLRLKNADKIVRQVVRVTLNSEGKITEFEFAEDNTAHEYGYDNTRFTLDFSKNTSATYYSNSVNMVNLKYFIKKNTICFAEYIGLNEDEPYGIISATGFSNGSHPIVALYDANEKREVAAMSTYKSVTGTGNNLMLVDNVRYVNRDGENCMQISGIYCGQYVSYTALYEDLTPNDIKRGDVVTFGLFENRIISLQLVKRLSDTTDKTPFMYDTSNNIDKYSGNGTIFGEIYSRGDNNIVTVNPEGHPNGKLTSSSFSMLLYNPVYVATYDCKNDIVSIGEMRDFNQICTPDKNGNLKSSDRNVMVLIRTEDDRIEDAIIVYY